MLKEKTKMADIPPSQTLHQVISDKNKNITITTQNKDTKSNTKAMVLTEHQELTDTVDGTTDITDALKGKAQ